MNEQPPKSTSILSAAIICATIALIAYLAVSQHSRETRRLWLPVVVDNSGKETILGETRQMEFWSPSVKTKDYLHSENGEIVSSEKWEVISNDEAVMEFGTLLRSNVNVLGYRRVEAWGQGRSSFKPGWWWTMNVFTNYTVGDLAHTYQSYWKSAQPVFIEVIDNRGSEDK